MRLLRYLAWQRSVNTVCLELEVSVEREQTREHPAQVNLRNLLGHLVRLEVGDNHQEDGVGADSAVVRVVVLGDFQVLFEHEDERLYDLILG